MVSIREKIRQRREARRKESGGRASLWRRFRDGGGIGSLLLAAGFYLSVVLINIWPIDPLPYHHEGQYVPSDIYARAGFQVLSPKKMGDEESRLKLSTPAVFRQSEDVAKFLLDLQAMPETLKATSRPADLPEVVRKNWAINDDSLTAWRSLREGVKRRRYDSCVRELGKAFALSPMVDSARYNDQMFRGAGDVTLVRDPEKTTLSKIKLVDSGNTQEVASLVVKLARDFEPPLREGIELQLRNLLHQPTYVYDELASAQVVTDALAELKAHPPSVVYDAHVQGDRIVSKGDLTTGQLTLLEAEQREYLRVQGQADPFWALHVALGRAMTLLILVGLLAVYVYRYERELVTDHYLGFAVVATLLATLAVSRAMMFSRYSEPMSVLAVIMAAVVLNIGRNQRFALTIAFTLSILTIYQHREGLGQFIVLLAGSSAAALALREIRSRTKLIEIGALCAAVVLVSVWAVAASAELPWDVTFMHAIAAAVAAFAVGFLALGALPLIERFFRVATSMTLLEWCDASRPLLKRLSTESPGTFNHSLQLGTMCEAAAETIGARGLLARAGAYYHDIGKTNKTEYFVENQGAMSNPHAKLSPAMSLLIIIGHVKDGLELAKQFGLPAVLREFIASHHGTTLVQYFYHAATEQRKADIDRAPDEVEFRYPGPKPRSKEAAILMLADASESSVRAMPEPSPGRIENQVNTVVTKRLMDRQLDECDLTLREVHQIEASLIRSICGIYHSRIAYPRLPSQQRAEGHRNDKNGNDHPGPQEEQGNVRKAQDQ